MTKLAWSRDGDQWVATANGREARITRNRGGPLGDYFSVRLDGKHRGGSGGGTAASGLARAKEMAAEFLSRPQAPKEAKKPSAKIEADFDYVCKLCGI